jgi:hypothetical protein
VPATLVQSKAGGDESGATATTTAVTFDNPCAAGNLIVVYIATSGNQTYGATGNSNTYSFLSGTFLHNAAQDQSQQIGKAENINAGATTVTVSHASAASRRMIIEEWSGLATSSSNDTNGAAQDEAAPGTGTDAVNSTTITTTVNGDLIVGLTQNVDELSPGTGTISNGTGFSSGTQFGTNVFKTENKIQSTAGSVEATFTAATSHNFLTSVAAFKVSSSTLEQNRFRFRNDDGNEVGATGIAAENTNAATKTGVNVRLRTLINATNTPGSKRMLQQYRKVGTTEWKGLRGPGLARSPVIAYSTSFAVDENPMSENGIWVQGGTVGLDWQNVKTLGGKACASNTSSGFNDCGAHLDPAFAQIPNDQQAVGTIFKAGGYTATDSHECELLIHWLTTAHNARGFENTMPFSGAAQQVRWNGAVNDFTVLSPTGSGGGPFNNGSVIKAKMVGNVLTLYQDATQILTVTDATFPSGNPGVGAFVRPATGQVKENYCWNDFSAGVAT